MPEESQPAKKEINDNYSELADQQLEEIEALDEDGVDEDFSDEKSEASQKEVTKQDSFEIPQEQPKDNLDELESTEV